jgi:hypothetical protein
LTTEAAVTRTDSIRAADEDRERIATLLGEHHALGRLDADEFNQRLDAAYHAVTLGQLDAIVGDLPPVHSTPRAALGSVFGGRRPSDARTGGFTLPRLRPFGELSDAQKVLRVFWVIWTIAVSVNLTVWILVCAGTGQLHYFWPAWVAGPYGAVLLSLSWFAGSHERSRAQREQHDRTLR